MVCVNFLATGKGHSSPPFFGDVYYGQMAGWIRIPLDTEVGLGPSDMYFLDGDPAPPMEKGIARPQLFGPLLWPTGPHFTHNLYSRLGNVRRVVFMAILPDNCHQCSSLIAQSEMYGILKFLVLNSAMWLTDTERCEAKPAANQAPIVNHMLQTDENWDLGKQNMVCTLY